MAKQALCIGINNYPGTQNDFRLEIAGTAAALDRGKVYTQANELLTISYPCQTSGSCTGTTETRTYNNMFQMTRLRWRVIRPSWMCSIRFRRRGRIMERSACGRTCRAARRWPTLTTRCKG